MTRNLLGHEFVSDDAKLGLNATWSMAVGGMVGGGIVCAVIGVYVVVALGAASLVGAGTIVEQKEVGLAAAGKEALGVPRSRRTSADLAALCEGMG
jgi:hypothetical protein